jgi:hypothetical protein
LPADGPRVVIFITVKKPRGKVFGGAVAAPACARMAVDILPALKVLPAGGDRMNLAVTPVKRSGAATFRDVPVAVAVKRLTSSGLRAQFDGKGSRVLWSSADSGTLPEAGNVVLVKLGGGGGVMPALVGLSVREAMRHLGPLAANVNLEGGGGWVVAQSPPPGAKLDGECTLVLGEKPSRLRWPVPIARESPVGVEGEIAG